MHPAFSILLFTTLSGAGYGLLFWVGLGAAAGLVPRGSGAGVPAMAIALMLITAGLLSSVRHLGHPERAWRALAEWRSSWLSREGAAALLCYPAAAVLTAGFVVAALPLTLWRGAAFASALLALVTVVCTASIYSSLTPIAHWHNRWVLPNYLALAAMSGALCLAGVIGAVGTANPLAQWVALIAIPPAALLKLGYWRHIDRSPGASTAESATGLGRFGRVRLLEAPHTSENYLMKEMGFRIARKHARKLRRIATQLAFALPFLLMLLALEAQGEVARLAPAAAALMALLGILVERWLFFAEAKHTVTLYYGADRA